MVNDGTHLAQPLAQAREERILAVLFSQPHTHRQTHRQTQWHAEREGCEGLS